MWKNGARGKVLYWAARGNNPIYIPVGDFIDHRGYSAVHYAAQYSNI